MEYDDVIVEEGLLNKDISLKTVQKKGIVFDCSKVLYGKLRPYLHNWLNPDFAGVAVGDWWVLRPVDINKNFIYRLIQTQKFNDVANQSTGSKMPRADWNLVSETEFMVPRTVDEQAKIGNYFRNLDYLITLHHRKWKSFENKVGSAWEQRKLDEVFDCSVSNNTYSRSKLNYEEGSVYDVHYGDVLVKYGAVLDVTAGDLPYITDMSKENFIGQLLRDGDIVFADTAEDETTGKACEIAGSQNFDVVAGLHTMVCRPKLKFAPFYLGYYINSDAYHRQLLPLMQGIKVLSLSKTNMQNTAVQYPADIKEQAKIGSIFKQLDDLITLHQQKLFLIKKCKNHIQLDSRNQRGKKLCKN